MSSYKKFQTNVSKYNRSADLSKRIKGIYTKKDLDEKKKEQLKKWHTYYILNPHRFLNHYCGMRLKLYQMIIIYLMSVSNIFVCIAARAAAKSYLIAAFVVGQCILRPGLIVVITSATKDQSSIIIGAKIKGELCDQFPLMGREISKISTNKDNATVEFHNGSRIIVKVSNDSARGERAHIIIFEEFRMIDKNIIDTVFIPFLISRIPPYLSKAKYANDSFYREEGKQLYISSAWYKSTWIWEFLIKCVNMHYAGKKVNFIGFDYRIVIESGIKSEEQIMQDKETLSDIGFLMEYENIMFGQNEHSYFKYDDLDRARTIKKCFLPPPDDNSKGGINIKYTEGEIRVVSLDSAVTSGKDNDNTVMCCWRFLPTNRGYEKHLVYVTSMNGVNSQLQALYLKRLYNDFESHYIVMDVNGIGKPIYDILTSITYDELRGIEYDAYTVFPHHTISQKAIDDLTQRTLAINAKPIIYPIIGGGSVLNEDIANAFRDNLQKSMIKLLVDEVKAGNMFKNNISKKNKNQAEEELIDIDKKIEFISPYVQTSALISETVALEWKVEKSGKITVDVSSRMNRKDRYSACSYGCWFGVQLDAELLKEESSNDDWKSFVAFGKKSFT